MQNRSMYSIYASRFILLQAVLVAARVSISVKYELFLYASLVHNYLTYSWLYQTGRFWVLFWALLVPRSMPWLYINAINCVEARMNVSGEWQTTSGHKHDGWLE